MAAPGLTTGDDGGGARGGGWRHTGSEKEERNGGGDGPRDGPRGAADTGTIIMEEKEFGQAPPESCCAEPRELLPFGSNATTPLVLIGTMAASLGNRVGDGGGLTASRDGGSICMLLAPTTLFSLFFWSSNDREGELFIGVGGGGLLALPLLPEEAVMTTEWGGGEGGRPTT